MNGVKIKTGLLSGTYIEVYTDIGVHYDSKYYAVGNHDFQPYIDTIPDGYIVLAGIHRDGVNLANSGYNAFT